MFDEVVVSEPVRWRRSRQGNLTVQLGSGCRLTVFKSKKRPGRWAWSISHDLMVEFSKGDYGTEDEARQAVQSVFE